MKSCCYSYIVLLLVLGLFSFYRLISTILYHRFFSLCFHLCLLCCVSSSTTRIVLPLFLFFFDSSGCGLMFYLYSTVFNGTWIYKRASVHTYYFIGTQIHVLKCNKHVYQIYASLYMATSIYSMHLNSQRQYIPISKIKLYTRTHTYFTQFIYVIATTKQTIPKHFLNFIYTLSTTIYIHHNIIGGKMNKMEWQIAIFEKLDCRKLKRKERESLWCCSGKSLSLNLFLTFYVWAEIYIIHVLGFILCQFSSNTIKMWIEFRSNITWFVDLYVPRGKSHQMLHII